MSAKQIGIQLQSILDNVVNVPVNVYLKDLHSLIKVCFQLTGPYQLMTHTGSILPQSMMTTLIKPMQAAIDGQAAELKVWKDVVTKLETSISTSNQHVASNEKQNYDQLQDLLSRMEGLKKDISATKTHFGNQGSIIDDMKNQIDANSKETTMLRALLKDHTATKHHGSLNPIVVYGWDVQPYELGIRTKTSVKVAGHSYEYKYTMNGRETSITASDANLKIGVELGTLTYTPLNKDVSKVIIEQTS